jgi:hypothetical protein
MQKELQDVIQEFNVSLAPKTQELIVISVIIPHQLTAAMRTEMKIDTVKELAGRMMVRMSELQTQLDMVLRDNSSKSSKPSQRRRSLKLGLQSVASAPTGMPTSVRRSGALSIR